MAEEGNAKTNHAKQTTANAPLSPEAMAYLKTVTIPYTLTRTGKLIVTQSLPLPPPRYLIPNYVLRFENKVKSQQQMNSSSTGSSSSDRNAPAALQPSDDANSKKSRKR